LLHPGGRFRGEAGGRLRLGFRKLADEEDRRIRAGLSRRGRGCGVDEVGRRPGPGGRIRLQARKQGRSRCIEPGKRRCRHPRSRRRDGAGRGRRGAARLGAAGPDLCRFRGQPEPLPQLGEPASLLRVETVGASLLAEGAQLADARTRIGHCSSECTGQTRDGETERRRCGDPVEALTQGFTRRTDTYLRLVSNPPVRQKRAVGPTAPFPHIGVPGPQPGIEKLAIDTIRTLSMDAVQKANSGHPGAPMALAPVAYALWQNVLRYDPAEPTWPNRDRFLLSNGHASMLLYSVLHLTGVRQVDPEGRVLDAPAVSLDDIKSFRQLGSRTPGHPEYGVTTGVESTTGPLGQGAANSVGMAIASRW